LILTLAGQLATIRGPLSIDHYKVSLSMVVHRDLLELRALKEFRVRLWIPGFGLFMLLFTGVGCQSPYYSDRVAGIGALAGAGSGALIGSTSGNAGAGAVLGAGIGALTGAAIGGTMDEQAAQNRAAIAAQTGRPVPSGAATIEEVVSMSRAGVDGQLIQNYIRTSGVARPLTAADVIALHNQGVSTEVIQTMQKPPVPQVAVAPYGPAIIEEHYHGPPPYCGPHYGYHRGPATHWGVSISK
jgi:hypothetical protein